MAVRELAAFSAGVFRDALKGAIKKPDGSDYVVFDQFYNWKLSLDRLQDDTKAVDIFAHDIKDDLDGFKANVNNKNDVQDQRLAALEAQQTTPFPGSG